MNSVPNPWQNISWKKTVADCDLSFFNKEFGSLDDYQNSVNARKSSVGLTFDCLPEPFSGDVHSNVYCLNKNPGAPDKAFYLDSLFEKMTIQNLTHQLKGPFWTKALKNVNGKVHDGVDWMQKKTAKLSEALGIGDQLPNLFFVDYFPYHSAHGFPFPKDLPSYAYRNYLVNKAMEEDKYIIVLRQKKDWFEEKELSGLKGYKRLFELKCPAGAWLSPNNIIPLNGACTDDLLTALM